MKDMMSEMKFMDALDKTLLAQRNAISCTLGQQLVSFPSREKASML